MTAAPTRRPSVVVVLGSIALAACPQAPSGELPGTTEPVDHDPISIQEVLQGIQIGESGDTLPCDQQVFVVEGHDELFTERTSSWSDVPYAYEGVTGTADIRLTLDAVWEVSYESFGTGGTTFDCTEEPHTLVGAMWLDIDGTTVSLSTPVVAPTQEGVYASSFQGEVDSAGLALGAGDTYVMLGSLSGTDVMIDLLPDIYSTSIGGFGL